MFVKKNIKNNIDSRNIKRYNPGSKVGLSTEQVEERINQGLTNKTTFKNGKGYLKILFKNIFTFFNIMYILITILLLSAEFLKPGTLSISDFTFLILIAGNTLIGIIQEIRAKSTIDKLSLLTQPLVTVIRDGKEQEIKVEEVVIDDIMFLNNGKEIISDSILIDGEIEVNESQLTGESVSIRKTVGSMLYSGSFVVSGSCHAQVEHVGDTNEINKLTSQAKTYRKPKSIILNSLSIFLRFVAVFLIITGISMFVINMTRDGKDYSDAIKSTSTALLGMIPAGLYLITSVALAVSTVKLAKKRTLVQDMYCIEMLARTDVLCLDKTGTLTDGTMSVVRYVDFTKNIKLDESIRVEDIVSSMNTALQDANATSKALVNYFGFSKKYKAEEILSFSSERKFSSVTFIGKGTYLLGAPEIILKNGFSKYESEVNEYANQGLRVVALGYSASPIIDNKVPKNVKLVALILIEDKIRPDAYDTIRYFKENDVDVKIISGDNPVTVSEVARRVGVERADEYISLDGMSDEDVYQIANSYTVFGRVKPHQKQIIVKALKDNGKTVAMTGDGVNDIPALKEADCSIAMASGSDAVRKVSQLVLLDSNFSSMPQIVNEGRRAINNVSNSASLFLVKTLFIIILAILTVVGFIGRFAPGNDGSFPIDGPSQLLILEMFAIGLPSMYLAIQPNYSKNRGNFLYNVLKSALPGALAVAIEIMLAYVFSNMFGISADQIKTISVLCATGTCFMVLFIAFKPFNPQKILVFIVLTGISFTFVILSMTNAEITIPLINLTINFRNAFGFVDLTISFDTDGNAINATAFLLTIILNMMSYVLITAFSYLIGVFEKRFYDRINDNIAKLDERAKRHER